MNYMKQITNRNIKVSQITPLIFSALGTFGKIPQLNSSYTLKNLVIAN